MIKCTLYVQVCLPFTDISNSCHQDIMQIPICTSGKDVYILATDTLNRGSETLGPIKFGLTHLSLLCRPGPFVALCVLYHQVIVLCSSGAGGWIVYSLGTLNKPLSVQLISKLKETNQSAKILQYWEKNMHNLVAQHQKI